MFYVRNLETDERFKMIIKIFGYQLLVFNILIFLIILPETQHEVVSDMMHYYTNII